MAIPPNLLNCKRKSLIFQGGYEPQKRALLKNLVNPTFLCRFPNFYGVVDPSDEADGIVRMLSIQRRTEPSHGQQPEIYPILNHKGSSGKLPIIRSDRIANRTMWADVRRTLSLTCSVFAKALDSAPLSSPGWWLKNISITKTTKNTIFKISSTPPIK